MITPNKPEVLVYKDREDLKIKELVWAMLSGRDFLMETPKDDEDFQKHLHFASIAVVILEDENDPACGLVSSLQNDPDIIGCFVAVILNPKPDSQIKLLGCGFDLAIDQKTCESPEFRQFLINKLDKFSTRVESKIRNEEYSRFVAALSVSPDAFIIFDENNKLFFASEHYKRAYPENADHLEPGMDVREAFSILGSEKGYDIDSPDYEHVRIFWETLEGQIEFIPDDKKIWRITARKLPDNLGTIVSTTDITAYRLQEQQLTRKSNELALALQKEQEASMFQKQFINMVSHEFRTPLSIIDGNTQIIQRRGKQIDEDTLYKRTRIIRSAVSRLVHMMEDILSSNMMKTGKFELNPEPLELFKLVQDICDEFSDLSSGHHIEADILELPDDIVMDRKSVSLTLSNLLSNAVKYSPPNTIISVYAKTEGNCLWLSVKDRGYGIPEDEQKRVFDTYYRGSSSTNISGTGIGLSLVKGLVDMHGGKIDLESKLERGTTITVIFPFENAESTTDAKLNEDQNDNLQTANN